MKKKNRKRYMICVHAKLKTCIRYDCSVYKKHIWKDTCPKPDGDATGCTYGGFFYAFCVPVRYTLERVKGAVLEYTLKSKYMRKE